MRTAEEILKSKLDSKIMVLNHPDYTFNKVIEAMEEYASQFSATVKVTDEEIELELENIYLEFYRHSVDAKAVEMFMKIKAYIKGLSLSSSEVSKIDAIKFAEWVGKDWIYIEFESIWEELKEAGSETERKTTSELYTLFLQSNTNK